MLKPSELDLDGKYIKILDYEKLVRNKIKTLSNSKLTVILDILIDAKNGQTIDISKLTSSQIAEIKNYYAEVIGPILIYKYNLFPQASMSSSTTCYFSSSQTQSLYDFKMVSRNQEYLFSNKQMKGGTNTLKPVDVVNIINENDDLKKKWANSKVYKTFKILNENNVISGPIKAISLYYSNKVNGVSIQDMNNVIKQMTKNDVIIEKPANSILSLVNKEEAAKKNLNDMGYLQGTVVNFIFEKILVNISKNDPDYNQLFLDATNNNIIFFKFDINSKGVVSYKISDLQKESKKAILRSKQGVERRSSSGKLKLDKLGFQP